MVTSLFPGTIPQDALSAASGLGPHVFSGAYPRQNSLALALRELGRVERTFFTLEWLQSPELRRRVHVGLNKGGCPSAQSPTLARTAGAPVAIPENNSADVGAVRFWFYQRRPRLRCLDGP
jgi:hypothetical protein